MSALCQKRTCLVPGLIDLQVIHLLTYRDEIKRIDVWTELEGDFEQDDKTGSDAGENHKLETQSDNQTLPADGVWLVIKKTRVVSLSVLSTVNRQ